VVQSGRKETLINKRLLRTNSAVGQLLILGPDFELWTVVLRLLVSSLEFLLKSYRASLERKRAQEVTKGFWLGALFMALVVFGAYVSEESFD
jgi:hypothetical protein